VENLWQQAITRLEQIPKDDLAGYAEAQKLLAEYDNNLGQVKIRRQAEADSVQALQQAQSQKQRLLASLPTDAASLEQNRNSIASQLQAIIDGLRTVQPGTTAYLEAQALLLFAQNKLKQLQS